MCDNICDSVKKYLAIFAAKTAAGRSSFRNIFYSLGKSIEFFLSKIVHRNEYKNTLYRNEYISLEFGQNVVESNMVCDQINTDIEISKKSRCC